MEAPAAIGVSDDFFREHVASELAWIRKGRKKVVRVAELERWLAANEQRTIPTPESASPALGGAKGSREIDHAKRTA